MSVADIGTIIDDRYEVLECLGEGGMGSVFKCRELGLGRIVAIKLLHPSLIGD
jgi:eukaryotic-like serine/threonine-protein kinase